MRTRSIRADSSRRRSVSVGEALRKARKGLIIRQIACAAIVFVLIIALMTLAVNGYFGRLIQYLSDRLM
jgi:hypothetical protein